MPFSSQSSPDPEMADSESCEREMPVDWLYPHVWRPECASASDLWREKESAPSEATEGANPTCAD